MEKVPFLGEIGYVPPMAKRNNYSILYFILGAILACLIIRLSYSFLVILTVGSKGNSKITSTGTNDYSNTTNLLDDKFT